MHSPARARRTTNLSPDWDTFFERVSSGQRKSDLYGKEGMPTKGQFKGRCKADKQFRRRAKSAKPKIDWQRFLRAGRSGRSADSLFGKPGMPTSFICDQRRRKQPDFDASFKKTFSKAWVDQNDISLADAKAKIVNLILAGEGLESLSQRQDMPSRAVIREWRKDDPAFEHRYREAVAKRGPTSSRDRFYKDRGFRRFQEQFDQIVHRMTEGECVCEIFGRSDDLISYATFATYVRLDPEKKKHCNEALVAGRKKQFRGKLYSEDDYDRALRIIKSGFDQRLSDIVLPEDCPTLVMLYVRSTRYPEFSSRLREAFSTRPTRVFPKVGHGHAPGLRANLDQIAIYKAADAAVHRGIEERDDVISDIVMAVLTGVIAFDEIKRRAKEFITANNRNLASWNRKYSSLDAPVFSDGNASLLDLLVTDTAFF